MKDKRPLALVSRAECDQPHDVLGPHFEGAELLVRAFFPDASAVRVEPTDGTYEARAMRRITFEGVWEVRWPAKDASERVPSYEYVVQESKGSRRVIDPYAFEPTVGEIDRHLFGEGNHERIYRCLGAHLHEQRGVKGCRFAVWAPAARRVSVVGEFNHWDGRTHQARRLPGGIWELFVPGVGEGAVYKYEILAAEGPILKADPYARESELRPHNASKVSVRRHQFADETWLKRRARTSLSRQPLSIYEVHLGSWKRLPGEGTFDDYQKESGRRCMTYRELADHLLDHVVELGFTHIELLPIMEHPYDGSWGYQVTGYYAPTARYGTPDDFRYFVDECHARGVGVILDWVPAHFPRDGWALGRFDGTAVYEHADPRQGEHKQWDTYVFNYGRNEVRNFLVANALYWFDEFHVDGLRVDAVASLLYLDYAAAGGEWLPNEHGGRENLAAIKLLREVCDRVHEKFPGAIVVAEESTTWPGVTRPTYLGGLGFDFKWNMGWMHDTLDYFEFDPVHRAFHHNLITFGLMYAFSERFLLPFSHDEVVHLKKSLAQKMPGDRWQMMANLRTLFVYQWAHPGKKLLFMGGEIAQWSEWNHSTELDWELLSEPDHAGVKRLVGDLNSLYRQTPALYEVDDAFDGFRWIDANDAPQSVASFIRFPASVEAGRTRTGKHVVFVGNFTPIPRQGYRIGVPRRCRYLEILNTDASHYGGSGLGNLGVVEVENEPSHGMQQSIVLTLPPLSAILLAPEDEDGIDEEEIAPEVSIVDPHEARQEPGEDEASAAALVETDPGKS